MLAVLAVSLHLCFLQLNPAGATEHRRTYITLPSPPSVLNHGPPIPSLCLALALCLALFGSVPHSLSPPSFSLTVSPVTLTKESSLADAFSPTCPYLQKKARGGKKKKNSFLWIWPLYHSSLQFPLCGGALVALWFSSWNTNDYSSFLFATSCPAPFLLAAFCQKIQ